MSGIVGIIHPIGQRVQTAEMAAMLERLQARGPDGSHIQIEENVGFGHCLLWTTPESLTEHQPLVEPCQRLLLTADARLDNRQGLIAQLDLASPRHDPLSDSQIILAAYRRWGLACPEHLEGDFAFALWDPREQQLFCVRDRVGVKPFYYRFTDHSFGFASEIQALFVLGPGVPPLNLQCLGDYLCNHHGQIRPILLDQKATLFQDHFSLPPGTWLRYSPRGLELQRYWHLDPEREIHLGSDQEYTEAFLDLFTQAVSCRLRSAFPVGIQLSGGLDSSFVAGVAAQIHSQPPALTTLSAIFPHLPAHELELVDEREFLQAVIQGGPFRSHLWSAAQISPLREAGSPEQIYCHGDSWFVAPNLYLTRHLYAQARQQGIRVILDGYEGDLTVSHGFAYLQELARQGRWLELGRQVPAVRAIRRSPWQFYRSSLRRYGIDPLLAPLRALKGSWLNSGSTVTPAPGLAIQLLTPDFIQQRDLLARYQIQTETEPTVAGVRGSHYREMTSGLIPLALESLDRVAAAAGVEARHPFYDRRLLEFCLALPAQQKLAQGWSRIILRRAMQGIVPTAVQWRVTKADLSPGFHRNFCSQEWDLLRSDTTFAPLQPYVDPQEIQRLQITYQQAQAQEDFSTPIVKRDGCALWYLTQLALWLDHLRSSAAAAGLR